MKAVAYLRVSTEDQVRDGYGLPAQEDAVRSYCRAHGWELVELYTDAARSGKSVRGRDALARLLDDAAEARFDRVVFWKLDRFGRNLRELLETCDRLEKLGIGIVSVQESIDTGTATGRMMRNVIGSVAEFEREIIVERIKTGLAEKARQGELLGPLPLGYARNAEKEIVLDPTLAPLVREAFTLYASGGYSLRDITQRAGELGLRSTKGNPLDRLSIRKMLTNATYVGLITYHVRRGGGVLGTGKHPALVDAETFGAVQEMLASNRRSYTPTRPFGREPYPLSVIATCGYDGTPLLGTKGGKQGRRYMRCSTAQRRGKAACRQPMVQADLLEAQIGAYVTSMRLPPEYLGEVVAELRRRGEGCKDHDAETRQLQREVERWRKLYVMGDIDQQRFKKETAPLKQRLGRIDRPREVLDVERAVAYLRDVGSLWESSPSKMQRAFIREVFARIVVRGDQVEAITPKPLYEPLFVLDRRERFGNEGGVVWLPGQDSNLQPIG